MPTICVCPVHGIFTGDRTVDNRCEVMSTAIVKHRQFRAIINYNRWTDSNSHYIQDTHKESEAAKDMDRPIKKKLDRRVTILRKVT